MREPGRNGRPPGHADYIRAAVESVSSAAQSALAASWRRSLLYHQLDPESHSQPDRVEASLLREAREQLGPLAKFAVPALERILDAVGRSGCCVLLANSEGLIIERRAMPSDDPIFARQGLTIGSIWSEGKEGTNGIGTSLAEQRPVAILGDEHFHTRNAVMSCMGAPIFDESARLAAVFDVSSCLSGDLMKTMAPLISMVVADAVRKIECENFRAAFPDCRIVMSSENGSRGSALLAVDHYDLVVGATRAARQTLKLSENSFGRPLADVLANQKQISDLRAAERAELRRALARANGNMSATARDLGIGRATLYRRMSRLGLPVDPDTVAGPLPKHADNERPHTLSQSRDTSCKAAPRQE